MKSFVVGTSALFALLAGPAMAADMPVKARPVVPVAVPVFTWTGCYVGANVGWARNNDRLDTSVDAASNMNATARTAIINAGNATIHGDGFTGGGQVGCNYQVNRTFVMGVEADINFLDADATRNTGNVVEPVSGRTVRSIDNIGMDWMSTIRGRAGFAVDRVFFYGTAGAAIAKIDINKRFAWDFADGCPIVNVLNECHVGGRSDTRVGLVAGGGIEWAWTNTWSLKAEFLHADFRSVSYRTCNAGAFPACPLAGSQSADHRVRTTVDVVRVGVNYHWAATP